MIKVEITSKEIIKPSSPTRDHLKNFKLSLLDQLAPSSYESLVLFYNSFHNNGDMNDHHHVSVIERSHRLKISLSETLSRFYPLAGRVKDNITIDCSDRGVVYVEARVDRLLSDFLEQPDGEAIRKFIPVDQVELKEARSRDHYCLLLVQSSLFSCGGVGIGVCLSHKIADAATVTTFIEAWAAAALGSGHHHQVLSVDKAVSLFPPRKFSAKMMLPLLDFNFTNNKCVTKRFVFYAPKIAALKAVSASAGVQQPTRVEAVTALIWKCAMNASRWNSGDPKLSVLCQCVNIRPKTLPPLPYDSVGNLVGYFATQKDESDIELKGLVRELRKEMQNFNKNYMEKLKREDAFEAITESVKDAMSILLSHDIELYMCSSLCNFPLYDIDFGWGKPTWVTRIPSGSGNQKNVLALTDTRKGEGSVEALVTLCESDMALFQRDPELLAYASTINPCVMLKPSL